MMRWGAVFWVCISSPASALTCSMTPEECVTDCPDLSVAFEIDPTQFAAPQNPNDPPRRQITSVAYGDTRFAAEAIMMEGGIAGFYHATQTTTRLMIVQSDGSARLVVTPGDDLWVGQCGR